MRKYLNNNDITGMTPWPVNSWKSKVHVYSKYFAYNKSTLWWRKRKAFELPTYWMSFQGLMNILPISLQALHLQNGIIAYIALLQVSPNVPKPIHKMIIYIYSNYFLQHQKQVKSWPIPAHVKNKNWKNYEKKLNACFFIN